LGQARQMLAAAIAYFNDLLFGIAGEYFAQTGLAGCIHFYRKARQQAGKQSLLAPVQPFAGNPAEKGAVFTVAIAFRAGESFLFSRHEYFIALSPG